jgi:hypothetical protein
VSNAASDALSTQRTKLRLSDWAAYFKQASGHPLRCADERSLYDLLKFDSRYKGQPMSYPPGYPPKNMNECWRSIGRLAKVIYNDPGNFYEDSIVLMSMMIGAFRNSSERPTQCSARDQWA